MKIDERRLLAGLEVDQAGLPGEFEAAGWRVVPAGGGVVAARPDDPAGAATTLVVARADPAVGGLRAGRAALLELARAVPPATVARVGLRLGLDPGAGLDPAGLPDRPGLVVALDAPGAGGGVVLAGRGPALDGAAAAARDLWMPHRVVADAFRLPLRARRRGHGPFARAGLPALTITGPDPAADPDPALLAASVQLALELALREARRRQAPGSG